MIDAFWVFWLIWLMVLPPTEYSNDDVAEYDGSGGEESLESGGEAFEEEDDEVDHTFC